MRRWFMSYAQVYYNPQCVSFGCSVYESDEHPIAKAERWSATYGKRSGFQVIVLSFQEVGPEVPDVDKLSWSVP
jgi:hypothetical protein